MIESSGLTYTYPTGDAPAVDDVTFAVRRGEIFGFLGPSGAGKSTTQKILIGLLRGHTGSVSVLGRDVGGWSSDLYERIGVSFELPNHFAKLTATENLEFFGRLYRPADPSPGRAPRSVVDPVEMLTAVGLEDAADVRVGEYSKGMKTRLSVARALQHEPELLFLDEPTAGLDPVNARRIRGLIRGQRDAGRTIVLTTHDMVTADEICDRVAFIVDGQIGLIDSPRELKLRHGKRRVRVEYGAEDQPAVREFDLDGLGDDSEFRALLSSGGIQTIHSLEASLEQVFVEVTGRKL